MWACVCAMNFSSIFSRKVERVVIKDNNKNNKNWSSDKDKYFGNVRW